MKLTTTNISPALRRKIVKLTLSWCKDNMGEYNKRKTKFKCSVRALTKQDVKKIGYEVMGQFLYTENKLVVYHNMCDNVEELIRTTIHEYTHYLQPIRTYYHKFNVTYSYYRNPLEVEAFRNESKLYRKCWKSISRLV